MKMERSGFKISEIRTGGARNMGQATLAQDLERRMPRMDSAYLSLVRTMTDPAHASVESKIPAFPDGKYPRVAVRTITWNATIEINAGEKMAFYNTPFFEFPFASRHNDSNYMTAIPNPMTNSSTYPGKWLNENKVWAWRCISQSATLTNTSPEINKGGTGTANRYATSVRHVAVSPNDAGTNPESTPANNRVLYALPGKVEELTAKPGFEHFVGSEGAYLISKPQNFNFVVNDQSLYDGLLPSGGVPTDNTVQKVMQFSDWSAPDTYYKAVNSVGAKTAVVGYPGNMDTVAFTYSAPAGVPQTFNIFMSCTYEFVPRTDCTVFLYEMRNSTLEFEIMQLIQQFVMAEKGIWPASYNGFGDVFKRFKNFVKDKFNSAKDFYKSNSKVLGPALDLIPGASLVRGVVDQYI